MKTSNKLLLGLFILILLSTTLFIGAARFYQGADTISGNGNKISQPRKVADFDGIKVRGRIKVYLTQGSSKKLELKGDQNLLAEVQTTVEDGMLHIALENKIGRNEKIEAYITAATIKALELSAGAGLETTNELKGEALRIYGSSGSNGQISLQYKSLECEMSAGSVMDLKGKVETATLEASSGAALHANGLSARKCSVQASAGALANIHVLEELSADVSSGGSLEYSGNPSISDVNSSSGGMIQKK